MSTFRYIYLHGLFGESILPKFANVVEVVDIYSLSSIEDLKLTNQTIVFAYSLGGRILLDLLKKSNYICEAKAIHFISTHLGLSVSEKKSRSRVEEKIIGMFTRKKISAFWNGLALFGHDQPITINKKKLKIYKKIFYKWRLSNQENHYPNIQNSNFPFYYHIGELDSKYSKLYEQYKLENTTIEVGKSHRDIIYEIDNIIERFYNE